ncbi:thioredoxin-dependent thiol peroxidase [Paenibacillus cymbidii]|uniref:thioredoxin-dependent thiol peroxidase n=1 Tax=Paenibacillus cymbidii TaxID=1639034 RepID=UPI001081354C|nr:thioredoxin-dependent thiol peroxidase [Paenibacillus cymbidii]
MTEQWPKVGEPAPDFTLPASNGRKVSLSGLRGKKVALFFYPQDMTPTCTQEACDFRDVYGKLKRAGVVVLGISPDDVASHKKFIAQYELPYLLLADEERKVCELYGVWQLKKLYGREYMGVVRTTFLVDEAGILVREWKVTRVKGHTDAVLAAAKELPKQDGGQAE